MYDSYYVNALRASELHNLLCCHHRVDEEGVDIPVSDISRTDNSKGHLGGQHTCFQNLLECTVPVEEKRSISLPYLMGFSLDCVTVSISSRHIKMIESQSNPKETVFCNIHFFLLVIR